MSTNKNLKSAMVIDKVKYVTATVWRSRRRKKVRCTVKQWTDEQDTWVKGNTSCGLTPKKKILVIITLPLSERKK